MVLDITVAAIIQIPAWFCSRFVMQIHFVVVIVMSAMVPYVPMQESFMISSTFSRFMLPQNPSAKSASPSRCIPRVSSALARIMIIAVISGLFWSVIF